MNRIDIFRGADLLVTISLEKSNNSSQTKKVMGDNLVTISFQDSRYINFKINDSCTIFGEIYKLNKLPIITKESRFLYNYTLVMNAEGFDLSKIHLLFHGPDNTLTESDFSLMGNADDFINLVIQNANRAGSGWIKGQVVSSVYKNLTFTKENCYNALARLAEEFSTEFWIEGKVIHLTARSNDTGYTFKHGRNKGLYEITRQNANDSDIATRLYAYGSEKNLPSDYLLLGKRLRIPAADLPALEKNVSTYGVIEHAEIFEDIFPHRTGKVTAVSGIDPFLFTDADIDFDVNAQLLPGLTGKVVFNTGQLAGYEFEINSFNNTTKQFRINKNTNEKVLDIPSALFRPSIGDTYVLVDIKMPDAYILAAELELKARALALLDQISQPQLVYNVSIDPAFLKRVNRTVKIGDLVWIVDTELEVQRKIRVVSTVRSIVDEFQYTIELSDIVSPGTISRIVSSQASTDRDVAGLASQINNNSILNNNVVGTLAFQNMPETSTTVGFLPIYIEVATGKLFRKI